MSKPYNILSLDGGGSWSLIQVKCLQKLFREEATGHEILRHFHLVAANSGGSIVLAGLIANLPLSAILEKLSETGIQFDYDRTALKRQGIDMDQLVAIDVKEVPPTELFDKLFGPLKLAYKVDGLRVTVTAE